jgi:hypothetical protein
LDPKFGTRFPALATLAAISGEQTLVSRGTFHRVAPDASAVPSPAVVLPFDRLFEIRAKFAIRLWRSLSNLAPGPNPAALSGQRRNRLIAALRALDGRKEGASYRDLAGVLFGVRERSASGWKTHSMRDRVIRAVKLGTDLMQGGYRQMLLHPYRRRIPKALLMGGDLASP